MAPTLVACDLLRMQRDLPPQRTQATKTGRDTSVTQQFHFGTTVADQDSANAAAIELVLDGRRVSASTVMSLSVAERQRIVRYPVMRLRRGSFVLHPQYLGRHIEQRLQGAWAFALHEAETNDVLAQRIEYLEAMTRPGQVVLKGLCADTRRRVLVSLGFPENHEAVTDERDSVEFNPRIVAEIPLSQGTMNIAVLPAIEADEATAANTAADARAGAAPAAGNQRKALLNRPSATPRRNAASTLGHASALMPRDLQSSLTPGSTWAGAIVPGSGRHLHASRSRRALRSRRRFAFTSCFSKASRISAGVAKLAHRELVCLDAASGASLSPAHSMS